MRRSLLLSLLLAIIVTPVEPRAEAETPAALLAHGKALLERNCDSCMGRSRAGVEQAIALIERAIDRDYPDKVATYKSLAEGYRKLELSYYRDKREQKKFGDVYASILKKILEIKPNDVETLEASLYTNKPTDRATRIAGYRKILSIDPKHASSWYVLGVSLLEAGDVETAVAHFEKAIKYGEAWEVDSYATDAVALLKRDKWHAEAKRISDAAKRRMEEIERQTGRKIMLR